MGHMLTGNARRTQFVSLNGTEVCFENQKAFSGANLRRGPGHLKL